jgi:hypothetical protein
MAKTGNRKRHHIMFSIGEIDAEVIPAFVTFQQSLEEQ